MAVLKVKDPVTGEGVPVTASVAIDYERYYDITGLDDSVCEYRMTYQNLAGPSSCFVIVEKQ